MPKYDYECKKCGKFFTIRHSVSEAPKEEIDCAFGKCTLEMVPSLNFRNSFTKKEQKTGEVVKEHIRKAQEEVIEQKKEMRKDYQL